MDTVVAKLPWSPEIWNRLHLAVSSEVKRVTVAQRFLPLAGPMPKALTVPGEPITRDSERRLVMDEAVVSPLCEIWSEFALTPQQVAEEATLLKARTLAIRAANFVTLAEDALIFNGDDALKTFPLLQKGIVRHRSGPAGSGSLGAAEVLEVSTPQNAKGVGRSIFERVIQAYAMLQDRGHYGPYALVLNTRAYAALRNPPANTFIFETDRLKSIFDSGLYATGTLPTKPDFSGTLYSLGGKSMDLVIGRDAQVAFLQEDDDGKYRFRVWKRFAYRLRDPSAVIHFRMKAPKTEGAS